MSHQRQPLPDGHQKVDRGYSGSKTYLMERLTYSEPIQEFRTIRAAVMHSSQFSIAQRAFQFARVTVEADKRRR